MRRLSILTALLLGAVGCAPVTPAHGGTIQPRVRDIDIGWSTPVKQFTDTVNGNVCYVSPQGDIFCVPEHK